MLSEWLDEVSNYCRYQPQRNELWATTAAKAHAVVENGKIKKILATNPGSGYCSPPQVKVEGIEGVELKVKLEVGKDLKKNGGIGAVEVVDAK